MTGCPLVGDLFSGISARRGGLSTAIEAVPEAIF
jgi:hypothetical protein